MDYDFNICWQQSIPKVRLINAVQYDDQTVLFSGGCWWDIGFLMTMKNNGEFDYLAMLPLLETYSLQVDDLLKIQISPNYRYLLSSLNSESIHALFYQILYILNLISANLGRLAMH